MEREQRKDESPRETQCPRDLKLPQRPVRHDRIERKSDQIVEVERGRGIAKGPTENLEHEHTARVWNRIVIQVRAERRA